MTFQKIAELFQKIEDATSRLEITDLIAHILKQTPENQIGKLIYLAQGKLGPNYEGLDLGLGESLVEESIATTSGYTKENIKQDYSESGDLGITTQKLLQKKKQQSLFTAPLTLEKVHSNLVKIATVEGTGSQEQKIKLLAELLNSATPLEAKYIVRIVLSTLRLGMGDPTILDALAINYIEELKQNKEITQKIESELKEKKEDKRKEEFERKMKFYLREKIEDKYNIYSDLGGIAKILKKNGLKGLQEITITAGIPIRPTLAERLPSSEEIVKKIGKCAVEAKYDGFRLQIHKNKDKVTIFSRRSERMTPMFPEIVQAVKEQINAETAIFEGEALAYNEETKEFFPFQITIQRKRKYDVNKMAKDLPLKLFIFDLMMLNNENLMEKIFSERRELMQKNLKQGKIIEMTESIITSDAKKMNEFFDDCIQRGLEGIIAKDLNAKYIAGARKFSWIKLKRSYKGELQDSVDVVIIGYYKGTGKRTQFGLGTLLSAVYDKKTDTFKSIAKIGTGMSEQMLKDLEETLSKISGKKDPRIDSEIKPDIWVTPKYVIEVRADEITKSPMHTCGKEGGEGYALRFPRLISIREDKKPEEATTVKEIISMYKQQPHVKTDDFQIVLDEEQ